METRSLIITGMHRSGTSLMAQIFYRAGLYMGDNLMKPSPNNPDGYFEDRDIIAFHDEILQLNGIDRWKSPSTLSAQINVPPDFPPKATELIRKKFQGKPLWGWKDPRTSWFLAFWRSILPETKFIFTYRRPEEVVWSLIRRGDYKRYSSQRTGQVLLALKHWVKTYSEILEFLKRNEESSLLLHIPDDVQNYGKRATFVQVVCDIWGLPLIDLDNLISQTYKPRLLKKQVPTSIRLIAKYYPPARETNNQLIKKHRGMISKYAERLRPGDEDAFEEHHTKSSAVISIISPSQNLYSETFIQAHIDRLPARVKSLYGYPLPNLTDDGKELYSSSTLKNRILNLAGRKVLNLSNTALHEKAVKNFLINSNVDVVLAEYGHTGVSMMEMCRDANIPLVVHFHGHDAYQNKILSTVGKSYPSLFNNAAALIVVSNDMRVQLKKLGAPEEKIIVNPCGVDISLFRGGDPANAPPTLIAVGRFVDKKAPHLTLLAFNRLFANNPDAKLIMFGEGPLLEACKQLADALCISRAVDFRGSRSHAEVADAMRHSRAFVQHSIQTSYGDSEGTPVAVLEASATGLPVVATRHAGIKDVIVDGETGLLVAEGDVQGMAQAMSHLIQNPSLSAQLGKLGRERAQRKYSMETSINRLWEVIEICIDKRVL